MLYHNVTTILYVDYPNIESILQGEGLWEDTF